MINKEQDIKEMEKQGRQCGEEFETSKGHLLEASVTCPECNYHIKYAENIEEKRCLIKVVYSVHPNNEHDTYLMAVLNNMRLHIIGHC